MVGLWEEREALRLRLAAKPNIPHPNKVTVAGSGTVEAGGRPVISTAKDPLSVMQSPLVVQVWNTPPVKSANPSERREEIGGPGLTANGM